MNCPEFSELLPQYLDRDLPAAQLTGVEQHAGDCPGCREHLEFWQRLSALPAERPSPMVRARFDQMLGAFQQGRWQQKSPRSSLGERVSAWFSQWQLPPSPVLGAALSLTLAIGFAAGHYFRPASAPPPQKDDMAELHKELTATRQLVVLSLLQQQSANERLQGVSWSTRVKHADPEIITALLQALRNDSSVDVRLAALDALRRYQDEPQVRKGMLDALQPKQSPMVQIALIDAFVELKDPAAVPRLNTLKQDRGLNPTVRQRVEEGIARLKS